MAVVRRLIIDPVSLLRTVLALAIFPGAAFTGLVSLVAARAGRLPGGARPVSLEEIVASLGVGFACGLLSLPGSPLDDLPVPISLGGLLVAFAGAMAWGSSADWTWHRVVAALAAVVPLLCLGGMAMTLSLPAIADLSGRSVAAARILAAAALLTALPLVLRPFDIGVARPARAALLTGSALVAVSLIVSGPVGGTGGLIGASISAVAVTVYAALMGGLQGLRDYDETVFAGLAAIPAAGAILLTILG